MATSKTTSRKTGSAGTPLPGLIVRIPGLTMTQLRRVLREKLGEEVFLSAAPKEPQASSSASSASSASSVGKGASKAEKSQDAWAALEESARKLDIYAQQAPTILSEEEINAEVRAVRKSRYRGRS